MKKIIKIACAVIMALYNWLSAMYCTPGPDNSNLINTEKAVPINPENNAKIKYNVPISLALLDKNHLSVHREIEDSLLVGSSLISVTETLSQTLWFSLKEVEGKIVENLHIMIYTFIPPSFFFFGPLTK